MRPSSHSSGELVGEPTTARRIGVRRIAVRRTGDEVAGRPVFLDPQRSAFGAEHARRHLDAPRQHIVGRLRSRKLAARLEQRIGDLGGLELLAIQTGLLQRHRGLGGERREQPLPVLVERGRREHQAAFDPVALGKLGREPVAERRADARDTGVTEPERCAFGLEQQHRGLDHVLADVFDRVRPGDHVCEGKQRLGALCLAPLLLVETCVLESDGRLAGEHLEQANVILVELVEAELRDHDHTGHPRAVSQRHEGERLLDLLRSRDPEPELALESVRHEQRLARLGDASGDAHPDPLRVGVCRGVHARVVFTDERDRPQLVAVSQHDTTVVVVDQEPKLGRDRLSDLLDVVEPVELPRE